LDITANIATIKARKYTLQGVVDSLKHQVTTVRVYGNDYVPEVEGDNVEVYSGPDYTDNAKFFWLPISKGLYLSCDDDIIYPPDYVDTILKARKKYPNAWLTFHGRRLKGLNLPYYTGHDAYQCLGKVDADYQIDVAGTGVSAFHTDLIKFDPLTWNDYRMSDLMASLECAKKNIRIICLKHQRFWINSAESHLKQSIHIREQRNTRQNELANVIYELVSKNR
jgi:hypothetical protein